MCFSAPASFTAGTALIAIDTYCLYHSHTKNKKYLLFALIPLIFGIQQILEGFIWLSIGSGNFALTHKLSYAYLFFALAFWPVFTPLAVFVAENTEKLRIKVILFTMIFAGLAVAIWSYVPILLGQTTFHLQTMNRSIVYNTSRPILMFNIALALYLLAVCLPFLIVSNHRMKIFGYMLIVSTIITNLFYHFAFTSVWCLFAAILSVYTSYILYHLPHMGPKGRSSAKRKLRRATK